jgi:hypothetical protein
MYGLMAAAAPIQVAGWFTPDVAPLVLAATACVFACLAGAESLRYKGSREHHLPKVTCCGRVEHPNTSTLCAHAACMLGGVQPELLSDADRWPAPLWRYANFAVDIAAVPR